MQELKHDEMDFDESANDISLAEYDITSTPNDFNIVTLFTLIDKGVIRIPPFQRNYVWDIKRASRLIESIVLGLPIPQVFLYEQDKNTFIVIDGQQRLLSIYFFIKQRFPTTKGRLVLRKHLTTANTSITDEILSNDDYFTNFKLNLPTLVSKEENKIHGLKFETLGDYKNTFEMLRTIRSVVIKQNEPDNDDAIYEIFSRLNTGGQNLVPQEIRMSVYHSNFYDAIIELNSDDRWQKILNQNSPHIHFKDVEILTRSLAMLCSSEYNSPLGKFLNSFSSEAKDFSEEKIKYLMDLFKSFLDSCSNVPLEYFATSTKQFKISLFEAIFVGACHKAFNLNELLIHELNADSVYKLSIDEDVLNSTKKDVSSKKSVTTRMHKAKNIIRFN